MDIAIKKICVASDFSRLADLAIQYGAAFARLHGAELHLLHVVQNIRETLTHADFTADGAISREYFRQMRNELPDEAEMEAETDGMTKTKQFLAALEQGVEPGAEVEEETPWWDGLTIIKTMRHGDAVEQICHYAKVSHIDLLILGTQGKTGMRHLLLGSVAERVVRQSPCPVLTVRANEHDFLTRSKAN